MNARIQDIDVIVEPRHDDHTGQLSYAAIADGHPLADLHGTELLYPTPEAATLAALNGGAR